MLAVPHMETRREQIGGYLMLMMCLALIGECVFDLCELRVNGGRKDADRVTLYLPIDRFHTAS